MTIVRRNCHCSHAVFSGDYGDYVTEDEEEESAPPLLLLGLVLAALSAAGSAAVVVACRRLRPGHKYQPGPASSQDYHASLHQTSSISTIHTNCTSSNTHNRSAEPGLSSSCLPIVVVLDVFKVVWNGKYRDLEWHQLFPQECSH